MVLYNLEKIGITLDSSADTEFYAYKYSHGETIETPDCSFVNVSYVMTVSNEFKYYFI